MAKPLCPIYSLISYSSLFACMQVKTILVSKFHVTFLAVLRLLMGPGGDYPPIKTTNKYLCDVQRFVVPIEAQPSKLMKKDKHPDILIDYLLWNTKPLDTAFKDITYL